MWSWCLSGAHNKIKTKEKVNDMNECEEDCGYCGACLEEHEYQRRIEDESKEE